MQLGIIGFPLGHSFSPYYFSQKFKLLGLENHSFTTFPLENISELKQLLIEKSQLSGLSVTIPYKEQVLEYVDVKSNEVEIIGACNCLKIVREFGEIQIFGFNTDCIGFKKSLLNFIGNEQPKALILGTGGASKAAKFVLDSLGIFSKTVSRFPEKSDFVYSDLMEEILFDFKLIINTSPLGMYPNIASKPEIPYQFLNETHYLFDMVYNPEMTSFLSEGKNRKCQIKNGLEMLHLQADAAWEIWNS